MDLAGQLQVTSSENNCVQKTSWQISRCSNRKTTKMKKRFFFQLFRACSISAIDEKLIILKRRCMWITLKNRKNTQSNIF